MGFLIVLGYWIIGLIVVFSINAEKKEEELQNLVFGAIIWPIVLFEHLTKNL